MESEKTYVEEGRSTVGELTPDTGGRVSADASTLERPEVLGAETLPVIPQFINHLQRTLGFFSIPCRWRDVPHGEDRTRDLR